MSVGLEDERLLTGELTQELRRLYKSEQANHLHTVRIADGTWCAVCLEEALVKLVQSKEGNE